MAKKIHPNEPYEVMMPEKTKVSTARLKVKYQRYYDVLTENLEAEPFLMLGMEHYLECQTILRRRFAALRKRTALTHLPRGERFLETAERKLKDQLDRYPNDFAYNHDLRIVQDMLMEKQWSKKLRKARA